MQIFRDKWMLPNYDSNHIILIPKIISKILTDRIAMIGQKCPSVNITLEIDIRKACDTIDWNFLISVMKANVSMIFFEIGFC